MTRPSIIRADTIDLQHQHAPSTQDQSHPRSDSDDTHHHRAPHQAETLRDVAHETAQELLRSPFIQPVAASPPPDSRQQTHKSAPATSQPADLDVADSDSEAQHPDARAADLTDALTMDSYRQHDDDAIAAAHNGTSSSDEEDIHGDSIDDLDDDLMDKISSSPSIEDGVYNSSPTPSSSARPHDWPRRVSSLPTTSRFRRQAAARFFSSQLQSSPISQQPRHLLLSRSDGPVHANHVESTRDTAPEPAIGASPESIKHGPETIQLHQEASTSKPIHKPATAIENTSSSSFDPVPKPPSDPSQEEDDAPADDTIPVTPFEQAFSDFSSDESLHDSEDIDFEFVYALHTFVATVEGQANATKGDTMVLLDDSNSYWWLVRVVKDSSIGYLPAEHIETPTERLARLNKHRNIDLSATMLGDQAVKQKTSFKGIRRKRKTVAFAEPTYVDYSDFDYSTEEEDIDELFGTQPRSAREQAAQSVQQESQEASEEARVEPLRTKDSKSEEAQDAKATNGEKASKDGGVEKDDSGRLGNDGDDDTSSVEEIIEETASVSRSKNGTVRNTDSFFNDEETKKITLTPNLLRDGDAAAARPSTDSAGKDSAKGRSSLEKMEKELVSDKERKKSKDKKPSAIRSFFSRKDKKKSEDDDESFGKRSMDIIEADDRDDTGSPDKSQRIGKLHKAQPRLEPQPQAGRKLSTSQTQKSTVELSSYLNETRTNDVSSVPPASMRIVDPETQETRSVSSNQLQQSPESAPSRSVSSSSRSDKASAALSKIIPHRSPSTGADPKPQKTKKAKTRMELDASDSPEEVEQQEEVTASPTQPRTVAAATVGATSAAAGVVGAAVAASKSQGSPSPSSPVMSRDGTATPQTSAGQTEHLTQAGSPGNISSPPGLVPDTSSAEDRSPNASPSPELISNKGGSAASSRKEATWDDVKLRAFFDEGDHVRDLLAVVYDKSDAEPVGADHPAVSGLFREQNAKLAEITTQLDNLLGDWLARKQRLRGSA
ncbi:RING finger domain-containing protein [Cordyceps fumosorosea ARSEF 2679]|uniref:RING finger domain-containing protein n=1 Tax=Cordyceps fumosorosea (strain ARSEF 2679) TaxID=1081104 RepID=A0A167Q341_CORFA|nr:RING finger domain-containing protein [Cordyceps fumosorosea ARSEF 2679]OAA57239.1 RING finger domain-containing protein [Cordyceps fumosorosea ARSEF 2679]